MEATVEKGPHVSALEPDAIAQIQIEAREKEAQGFARIYLREELKCCLPAKLKLSPLAMIPHKSRKYCAILDLLFALLVAGFKLPSVNDTSNGGRPWRQWPRLGRSSHT